MGRSQGTTIGVKIPIAWDKMTRSTRQNLRQIVGRDTRIIKAYLGIIQAHEKSLLTGKRKNRIDESKLHALTLTATRSKSKRLSVEHDMKAKFPRTSQNEFTECRQTAVRLYGSYLTNRAKRGRKASRPCLHSHSKRVPRWIFSPRVFKLIESKTLTARWWMNLRNSLDSVRDGKVKHDRLLLPLKVSPFHENQLSRGDVKAAHIFRDRLGKWWVTVAVRLNETGVSDTNLPPAVLGIDVGINKAACTALVTPEKVREIRFFKQEDKANLLRKYDDQVASLQRAMSNRRNNGARYDNLSRKLKSMRTSRENLAKEYDRVLVRQLLDYIDSFAERYTLHVAIGKLSNIRNLARRGNWKGRKFRRLIHSWAFSRISESLRHQLAQAGWRTDGKDVRYQAVPEAWTSIMCWKCGRKGTRPRQNLFICPTCGNKCNADQNGAINIAGRQITLTKSLHSVRGLGFWTCAANRAVGSGPKAQGRKSRGKSLLPSKNESHSGESAAVHTVQMDLLSIGDNTELSDDDQAVGRTVEILSVVEGDISTSVQKEEARSEGGIPSQ